MVSRTDEEWNEIFGKYFKIDNLEYFSWVGETKDTRHLYTLLKA